MRSVTGAYALSMSRREMLGKRQVSAPLMAQRTAHGALSPDRGGDGKGVQAQRKHKGK